MRYRLSLTVLFALAAPALAAETAWQELSPGVRLRLVSSDRIDPSGRTLVGFDLDMPPSTRTYWQAPGEGGLAMVLDWSGSRGVKSAAIRWPYPTVDESAGVTEFVYFGPTLLPAALVLDSPVGTISVSVVMGICDTQCLPARASFTLPIAGNGRPDAVNDLRLRQAEALAPLPWTGGAAPVTPLGPAPDGEGLLFRVDDPAIDPLSVLGIDATGTALGAPKKSQQPNLVVLPVAPPGRASDLVGSRIELTFLTPDGPFSMSTAWDRGSTGTTP